MFKTVSELKEFITWAKETKLKKFKLDQVEFEFSDLALLSASDSLKEVTDFEQKDLIDTEPVDPADENEALYWSAR